MWLEQWSGEDSRVFLRDVLGEARAPRPTFVGHLLGLVPGGDRLEAGRDPEVTAALFLMLKTLTHALDITPSEFLSGRARGGTP